METQHEHASWCKEWWVAAAVVRISIYQQSVRISIYQQRQQVADLVMVALLWSWHMWLMACSQGCSHASDGYKQAGTLGLFRTFMDVFQHPC